MSILKIPARIFFAIILFNAELIFATDYKVNSVSAFNSAQSAASSGDNIIWLNGTYIDVNLSISKNGINVKADTPGGVFFNGADTISVTGSNITFSGFQFTSGSISGIVIVVSGSHNILSQLNFNGYSAQKYINLQGQYNEVSYCNFENKPASAPIGNLIHITPDATIPGYNKIRYCSFLNMPGAGGDNGNECIRISNGSTSTYISRTVVEYCYFENTGNGDSEAISIKCRENILRYNTSTNNQNAMFVFRNGDNNIAYGNFFINAGGLRVKEANNIYCYNNYFEKSGVSGEMNAVTYVYYTANTLNVLQNINFIHNTFVDCGDIDFDKGATNNTWANNIFKKSSGGIFTGSVQGISFAGNIYTGSLGVNILSGMTNADPKLGINSDGYYGLTSSSPAINASSPNYSSILDIFNLDDDPNLMLDISGQPRPAATNLKDAGCDEYTTGSIINHPLKISDVGPSYLIKTNVGIKNNVPDSVLLLQNYPNPFNPETTINYTLPVSGQVSLKVFDFLGKEIVTVVNEFKPGGNYNIKLDMSKLSLSSGVYFYTLHAGNFIQTKKMLFLK